jgi:RHS repeat-associated protein
MKAFYYLLFVWLIACPDVASQPIPRPNIPAPNGFAVNSFTGNLFYQRNEQSLRGNGYRIYQSFYYNAAQDTLNYGYGHGWSFYYNVFYTEIDNKIVVQRADARKDTFLLQNGSYQAPAGLFDKLTKNGDQVILTSKSGEQHIFSEPAHRKLTRIQDTNGNFVSLSYAGNYPVKITNSTGRSLLLAWEAGMLKEAKDELYPEKKFSYTYNASLDLVKITDPLDGQKNISYVNHALTTLADENGNPAAIHYFGSGGRVKQIVSCNSDQRFSYLAAQRKTFVTQKTGSGNIITGYFFDQKGRLSQMRDGNGKTASFTYDSQNNLTKQIDFKGQETEFTYDERGNMLQVKNPLGNTTQYTYESAYNKPITFTDARGKQTTITYDGKGNLSEITRPGGGTEKFIYDNAGRIASASNANNQLTSYEYNSVGDLVKINYPIGSVQYEYNGNCCNIRKITDANGSTIEMTYDLLNRTKTVTDRLGNVTAYDYDAVGNMIKETDPNGNSKEYVYDGLNRLISVKLAAGTWVYDYDEQNNLVRMTDANGHATSYQYDKRNQLIKETDPMSHAIQYNYDDNGNLSQRLDPNGNIVNYTYDDLGRLTQKSYTGNTDKYSYDAAGNLVGASNENVAYSFEYDDLNRLLKKNILTWNKSLSYTYDALGNRKTMTDHDGGVTTYEYDSNNRLVNLKNPSNSVTTFDYDAGGRVQKQVNGNGTFATYHYDSAGRLDTLINWKNETDKISFFYYTYDRFGNRKTMTDRHGVNSYSYDGDDRLTSVDYANGNSEKYSFDGTGNRKQHIKGSETTNYTYNSSNQLQDAGVKTFEFDLNGNTVARTGEYQQHYKWDGENRMIQINFNSGKVIKYKHDPFGNKIVSESENKLAKYLYDEDDILSILSTSNETKKKFTLGPGVDQWLNVSENGQSHTYHKDGLNSIVEISSSESNVLNEYSYDIYGSVSKINESIHNEVLYTGRIFDEEAAIYDYRSRVYAPDLGRFLSQDFLAADPYRPLNWNSYNYVNSNPINFIDPEGTFPWAAIGIGAGFGALTEIGKQAYNNYTGAQEGYCWEDVLAAAAIGGALGGVFSGPTNWLLQKFGVIGPLTKTGGLWKKIGKATWGEVQRIKKFGKNRVFILQKTKDSFKSATPGIGAGLLLGGGLKALPKNQAEALYDELVNDPCAPDEPKGPNDSIPPPPPGNPTDIPVVAPVDPNEIIGPSGFEEQQWVAGSKSQDFKVLFENDPDFATAPAQNVTVYVPIHPKINPSSLRISDFGFGSFNFSVPPNTSVYTNRLDVRDSLGVFVDITAGLDIANRRAFWIFQSIDPETGLSATLPTDGGFLPVNDTTRHNGEGYVTFSVRASSQAVTGDTTSARASIIFDTEETIYTNVWRNSIDVEAPTSAMNEGTGQSAKPTFDISWEGQDDEGGTGIKNYSIYFSENSSPFVLFKQGLVAQSATFTGNWGSKYCFYVIATDNVGNQEPVKNSCELTVTVDPYIPLPVTWIYFKGQLSAEGALLKWATASEINAEKFVVQRSFNSRQFTNIGHLPAYGFSSEIRNYHFTDSEALLFQGKTLYYRLMQVDLDGASTYSNIVAVKISPSEPGVLITAYPNPFQGQITLEVLNVTISQEADQVELYASDGKKVYARRLKKITGSTVLLDELPDLSPGVYLLTATIHGKRYTIKMLKN